jgi:hypothetical protein
VRKESQNRNLSNLTLLGKAYLTRDGVGWSYSRISWSVCNKEEVYLHAVSTFAALPFGYCAPGTVS